MLFDRFKNEAAFRGDFVRPLLTRLGFVSVAELHGTQEFGKDFVFSELTPFGFLRHYAAVVKHEKTIHQSASALCNTVLAQVRQAFSVTFQLPDSDTVQRASNVIVFNSGKITENARTWLRSELDEERYGRNVHLLDGERLFQLDLTSTFRYGEQLIPRLRGIVHDIDMNLAVWKSIADSLPAFAEGRGSFTTALQNFVAAPFLLDRIPLNEIVVLIQECRIIDRICDRYMMVLSPKGDKREQETETLRRTLAGAVTRATLIRARVMTALSTFQLLSTKES
jgi:Restriction endonuclease